MKTPKQKLNSWIRNNDITILKFRDIWRMDMVGEELDKKQLKIMMCDDLSKIIKLVIDLSDTFNSVYRIHNTLQCYAGCNRSMGDIWRHIRAYRKDITLANVLACVYDHRYNTSFGRMYCNTIYKRVFYRYMYLVTDDNYKDEFGLRFCEWKDIDLQ